MAATSEPGPGGSTQQMEGGFARKASGLVRDFSQMDAWIYNVLALNLVVLIAFAYAAISATFPQASLPLAIVITGVLCTFEAVVYAFFMAIMPRSGGDYVFQSRVFGGGIATFFTFTAIVLSQLVLVALAAFLGATLVMSPFALLLGAQYDWQWMIDFGNWAATPTGIFVISAVYIAWCAIINILGLRLYALVQRYVFWLGMALLGVVLIMLLATSKADFVHNLNSFMAQNYHVQDAYGKVLKLGGATDTSFSLWATLLAAVYVSLTLAFPHWGVMQGGEIKRATNLRSNIYSIAGAEVFSFIVIAFIAVLLLDKVGHDFLFASGSLYFGGAANNPLPVPPFFGFFVALASGSPVFIWVAFAMFFCWYIMLAPNAPLGATRVMVAMSFDRVLPDWFGRVNRRTHTPINSIVVFSIMCVAASALYAYATWFVPLTFALVIPSLTCFGISMVAALLFPSRNKSMFVASVADRYRIAGVPVMSVCAVVFLAFVIFIDYESFFNSDLAINSWKGLVFVGGLYAVAFVTYVASKIYHKQKEDFDLSVVYKELPVE